MSKRTVTVHRVETVMALSYQVWEVEVDEETADLVEAGDPDAIDEAVEAGWSRGPGREFMQVIDYANDPEDSHGLPLDPDTKQPQNLGWIFCSDLASAR